MKNILIIGRQKKLMAQILSYVESHGDFNVTGSLVDADALDNLRNKNFDIVILGNDLCVENKVIFKSEIRKSDKKLYLIEYSGSLNTIIDEINEVLAY